MDYTNLAEIVERYPLSQGFRPRYGTAGYRGPSEKLEGVVVRVAVLAALRCLASRGCCGLMITASHNPIDDNGVKVIDYTGEMLDTNWEPYAELLVNAPTAEDVVNICEEIGIKEKIQFPKQGVKTQEIFLGHDTRPSSPGLMEVAKQAITAVGLDIAFEPGLHTTPQVHFRVWRRNRGLAHGAFQWLKYLSGGYMRMARGSRGCHGTLLVDCAHGVAAPFLEKLGNCPGAIPQGYRFELRNTGNGILNKNCGAEFVQKSQCLPENFADIADWQRCASVDGDADRVVYFTKADKEVHVLDGDRIASLAALHLTELLKANEEFQNKYKLGVILTAYSNTGLKNYLQELQVPVIIVPTGVKHLQAAAKNFDIGIYYEPNGHGSIYFAKELSVVLRETEDKPNKQPSDFELLAVLDTMNQATGDAVSNILFVEAILRQKKWMLRDWLNLYQPFYSKQAAIAVNNKSQFQMNEDETVCVAPESFQMKINEIVKEYSQSRAFVRPSGTEDVVRIFSESPNESDATTIVQKLTELVKLT